MILILPFPIFLPDAVKSVRDQILPVLNGCAAGLPDGAGQVAGGVKSGLRAQLGAEAVGHILHFFFGYAAVSVAEHELSGKGFIDAHAFSNQEVQYKKLLFASPYRKELELVIGGPAFKNIELAAKSVNSYSL